MLRVGITIALAAYMFELSEQAREDLCLGGTPDFALPSSSDLTLMSGPCWNTATGADNSDEFGRGYEYDIAAGILTFDKDAARLPQGGGPREVSAKFLEHMTKVVLADYDCDANKVIALIVDANPQRGLTSSEIEGFVRAVAGKEAIDRQEYNLREYLSAAYGLEKPMANALAKWSQGTSSMTGEQAETHMINQMKDLCLDVTGVVDIPRVVARRREIDAHCAAHASEKAMPFDRCAPNGDFVSLTPGWVRWLFLPGARVARKVDGQAAWDREDIASTARYALELRDVQKFNLTHREIKKHRDSHVQLRQKLHDVKAHEDVMLFSSGGNIWSLSDVAWPDGKPGFMTVARSMGMRTTAGPSGTTNRYILEAQFMSLNLEELYMMRLAIIAWFVSVADHSTLEVLMGAHDADADLAFPHDKTIMNPHTLLPDAASIGAGGAYAAARAQFLSAMASKPSPDVTCN